LFPFIEAARERGDDVLVVGPAAMEEAVRRRGHDFWAGGEPPEEKVAPIRERLPVAPKAVAARLANRELFGRLATQALLPAMEEAFRAWRPEMVLREPCEYASAIVACRAGAPAPQVAISLAVAEEGAITSASSVLETLEPGVTGFLRGSTYLSRFPASFDPSPFASTLRYREPAATKSQPNWAFWVPQQTGLAHWGEGAPARQPTCLHGPITQGTL
jgi:hypothetical protein